MVNSDCIRTALALLATRLSHPWQVAELAAAVGVSTRHFERCFKDELGVSPKHYLHTRRMQTARHLLANTADTIANIAAQVGIPDAHYFGKVFRKEHHKTPSEWREKHGKAADAGS